MSKNKDKKEKKDKRVKKAKRVKQEKSERELGYFGGVAYELKHSAFPNIKDVSKYTGITLLMCSLFALLCLGVNTGVLAGFQAIIK